MLEKISSLNLNSNTKIFENESLKNHTTFGVGGRAKIFVIPQNSNDIVKLIEFSKDNKIEISFMGSGSNIIASDNGFNGIIISLKKSFNKIFFSTNEINVEAGAMLNSMVKKAINRGYKGFESLVGVPGTVGGAIIMNAGAHGSEISELFISARTIDENGEIKFYKRKDINFSYRDSSFPKSEILLDAKFKLIKGKQEKINQKKKDVSIKRKTSQPLSYKSAGSIFKNPTNKLAAGYLIDKAGLKGLRIGDAEISQKHANFIINHGNAKSSDILNLIHIMKNKVKEIFDIKLELEVKIIGNENE